MVRPRRGFPATCLQRAAVAVALQERLADRFAPNLNPQEVTDPAFLRRMGYRLHLAKPKPDRYSEIFRRYAKGCGAQLEPDIISKILARYETEGRELRCCEPRDLIERARDICHFRNQPLELTEEILDLAWFGYFGHMEPE